MFVTIAKTIVAATVIVGSTAAASDCQAPADRQQSVTQHVSSAKPAKTATKVLMPAQSCTLVRYRNGDEQNVCAPSQGNPRRYPPYPDVPHGPGDQVKRVRYPAEWVPTGNAADAEAAREAAASGAWD